MKKWMPALTALVFFACTNHPDKTGAGHVSAKDMPSHVGAMLAQTEKYPDSVALRFQLADALDSLGAYTEAIGQIDSLIVRDSLNYGFWYRKAMLLQNSGDTTAALRSYKYAIKIYPTPDAMLAAANLLAETKDSIALVIARQIINMRLGRIYDAHAHFISGVYYARKKDNQKAIRSFDACIHNDHNYMEAYMEKGFIYYESRDINNATTIFRILTNINPTYVDAWYWLAKCQEASNNKTDAVLSYQTALRIDPRMTEAADALKRLNTMNNK